MRTLTEQTLLVRAQLELPPGFKMATESFCEGWSLTRSADASRLKKRIEKRGWNLVPNSAGFERSGVGQTSQHAVAGALTQALRRLTGGLNTVEIEHIQLTQYPWFFLARVIVQPYWIQESAKLSCSENAVSLPLRARQKSLTPDKAVMHPLFASAMPQLREMLVLS